MTEKKVKPNCYECRWRGQCPGDAHSKCCHPYNAPLLNDPMLQMMGIFASVGRGDMPAMSDKRLKIKANDTGLRRGWFHYPFNFDPVWLENCEGFAKLAEKDPRKEHNCEKPIFCEECPDRFKCYTEREKGETNE